MIDSVIKVTTDEQLFAIAYEEARGALPNSTLNKTEPAWLIIKGRTNAILEKIEMKNLKEISNCSNSYYLEPISIKGLVIPHINPTRIKPPKT